VTINGPLLIGGVVDDQHGVTVRKGASNVSVNGAVANGFTNRWYSVENQRGPTESVTFDNCIAYDCQTPIWLAGGTDITVDGGTFINSKGTNYPINIKASGATIDGITVHADGKCGAFVDGDDVIVRESTFREFGQRGGITFESGTGLIAEGNVGVTSDSSARWMLWRGDADAVIKNNRLKSAVTAYDENDSSYVPVAAVNNDPGYVYSVAPTSPINYHPYVAGSGWDPDGDSAGELVMTDDGGSTWQEIVALPNS
jgi:hypothetical protein